jgi:diaminopimelate epimerase
MTGAHFIKMQGLGNDFVVFDGRSAPIELDPDTLRAIADRRSGVGCDQIIVIGPAAENANGSADAYMDIRNADGSFAEACGNGARCIALLLMDESGRDRVTIDTAAGAIECCRAGDGLIVVDMGPARLEWRDIPLAREMDTLELDLGYPDLGPAVAVGMGNPHAVHFVDDAEAVDVAGLGPRIEKHDLFPARTNVEFAEVTRRDRIRLRVWERGVGITLACGTGACATAVAAARRGLTGRCVDIALDGGDLHIEWRDDGHVLMTGPAAESFHGVLPEDAAS